ncbi:hypothetical protein [Mycobacterium sp.]|uniref:hypothetical protein n=1 Tax=Mycobacterium sp. TaxID=1785 RepID=UPI000CC93E98|nr:hypothetical protein [Mycobacterium sp.]PJE04734.1 MAG: hypothetical protein CK428_27375 [Mycobacterium sp.]
MSHSISRAGSSLDTVREALQAGGSVLRPRGAEAFMASCPLHTDHSPSLSVTWRPSTNSRQGGAVLLHCFSCAAQAADLAGALGLRVADLFDDPPQPSRQTVSPRPAPGHRGAGQGAGPLPARITAEHHPGNHQWQRVRVYTYTDLQGRALQQVIRLECRCTGQVHKRFQQRYRVGRQWVYRKPEGFPAALYQPKAIATATAGGDWIWISEGEKDADTLTRAGVLATTNPQGAANFPTNLVAHFHNLHVAVVADRDLSGYRRALTISTALRGIAAHVVVLLPALETAKADLTDHIEAGLWDPVHPFGGLLEVTPDDLQALALAAETAQAADRFSIAITEMQAHHGLRQTVAGSAHAAARWRAEAARQLRLVTDGHHRLHRHTREHPSDIARRSEAATAALQSCIQHSYRSSTTPSAELKESA